jgi:hypothetical protein
MTPVPKENVPTDALRRNLARLHEGLQSAEPLDAETRELLETVADDIERTLEGEHDPDSVGERIERLEDAALRFEAQHPRFSLILSEVADALTKIGV